MNDCWLCDGCGDMTDKAGVLIPCPVCREAECEAACAALNAAEAARAAEAADAAVAAGRVIPARLVNVNAGFRARVPDPGRLAQIGNASAADLDATMAAWTTAWKGQ